MLRTRMLARLLVPAVGAIAFQALVAEEPVGTTPPSNSIHDWLTKPVATPNAQTPVAGAPVGPAGPARSIREWKSNAIATSTAPCAAYPVANPTANAAATPAVSATGPKSPLTFSLTSSLREGNLVVELDEVPIFNEKFQKPLLLISQTTTWDPLQVPSGKHRLSAKVYGSKKTYFSKVYDLQVSRTKGSTLRFVMRGDKLTVELAS